MAFKPTKKFWIHLGAGTVAVIVLAWGMTQCSGKQTERTEKEKTEQAAAKRMENAAHKIDSLLNANRGLNQKNADLSLENEIQADSIVVLNDSIAVLNDSLTNVNQRLTDCRNGKKGRKGQYPGNQGRGNQGAGNRSAGNTGNNNQKRVIVAHSEHKSGADSVVIDLRDQSRNNGAIIANGGGQNVRITLGQGSVNQGQIIVNNGGTVNNYVNQFHNGADTLRNDTLARKKMIHEQARSTIVFVTHKTVKQY